MADTYFSEFPDIYYNFNIGGKDKLIVIKDITQNVRIRKTILENVLLYDEYIIVDGENPEIISEKLYGTPYYHWVIMIVNQRYDYVADFPLPQPELEKFITQKYGAGNEDDLHHYQSPSGFIVDQDYPEATSVSNRMHEEKVNENKRQIKIINPALLPRILQQLKDLI